MTAPSSALSFGRGSVGSLSMLFTDRDGLVVFADRSFAQLAHHIQDRFGLRGPLYKVLGIGQELADELMAHIRAEGMVAGWRVEARTRTGELVPMWSASVATYDESQQFIGADLVITDLTGGPHANILLTNHIDALTVHLQQTMAESRAVHHQTYIQAYMGAQLNLLQVLLARLAGPEIRDAMEAQLARQCRSASWPLMVQGGELAFSRANASFQVYGEFQRMAIAYAASVLGRKIVAREMAILDSQLDTATLELVTQLGLRMS